MIDTNTSLSSIQIPAQRPYVAPSKEFVLTYLQEYELSQEKRIKLDKGLDILLELLIDHSEKTIFSAPIDIELKQNSDCLIIKLINKGIPIYSNFEQVAKYVDEFTYLNKGRDGQEFHLTVNGAYKGKEESCGVADLLSDIVDSEITIRQMLCGEEEQLSYLFFSVYGNNYINDYVYYPEKIREMLNKGKLISTVAVLPNGKIIGHVGLLKQNNNPVVYEAGLGVVDPAVKSRGLFSKLFSETINIVDHTPMQYCLYDLVTNHDYSQSLVSKYNACIMSIQIGGQISQTQAKLEKLGIGSDPQKTDRYSMLVAVRPQVEYPFGKKITLPVHVGELAEVLLKPLNISWEPSSRFSQLFFDGEYKVNLQPSQRSVFFDFHRPGEQAVTKILEEWQYLLKLGYQYAAVDIPVDYPGIGQLYDRFSKHHFFVSGFIPYNQSDRLGFRFQSLGPTRVDFDEIKVSSPHAQRLLNFIRKDYERNCQL